MGFEKYSVSELRELLVNNNICSVDEAADIKGKANLVFLLAQNEIKPLDDENETNDVNEVNDKVAEEGTYESYYHPSQDVQPTDPNWKEYVLSLFQENEVVAVGNNKYPTLPGLRRVAELILGDVVFSGPVDHSTTHPNDKLPLGASTVVYEIQIMWKLGMPNYLSVDTNLPVKTFRGLAGAHHNNVDGDFALYPEAIAETRAEARAYRKALSLSVVSYDELTSKTVEEVIKPSVDTVAADWNQEDKISEVQKTTITFKCEQLNVDLMKFINSGSQTYTSIDEVTKGTAAKMIKELSAYQQHEGKDIPEEIKKG